jgi:hypothetical protein
MSELLPIRDSRSMAISDPPPTGRGANAPIPANTNGFDQSYAHIGILLGTFPSGVS